MTPIEHCQFFTNKLLRHGLGEKLKPSEMLALEAVRDMMDDALTPAVAVHGILAYLNEAIPALEARIAKLEALIAKLPE